MKILAIETSCDETSVALVEFKNSKINILAEKTASQINIHKKYGGVVPEIAGRKHAEFILPTIKEVLEGQPKPDVIVSANGPGLITGLIIGVETAKMLSILLKVPIVSTNHMEGHIYSALLEEKDLDAIKFPALALIASGGHSELIVMKDNLSYEKIGMTRDDAAGECFDKVGTLLGFEYPGGPKVSKEALKGNPKAIDLPRPMLNSDNFDFSFAGLKTASLYFLQKNKKVNKADFAASFEQAVVDVLVSKTMRAVGKYKPKTIILAGGVSANKKLRETLSKEIETNFPKTKFLLPPQDYTTDNAVMVAVAGYFKAKNKQYTTWKNLKAEPNWELGE